MKNFLSLSIIFVWGCGASTGDPSLDFGGAGGEPSPSAGSGGTSGATMFGGAGAYGLGGGGYGGTAGSFGSGGTSGQATNNAGTFNVGGTFGAAGTAGGPGFGGNGDGGNAGRAAGGSAGSAGSGAQVCTSKRTWTSGNGLDMRPGNDCRGCHSFTIAGTVYPTLNEPNNCDGTGTGGIKVLITGADNVTLTLTPSTTSGNFYSNAAVKTPFSVKLTSSAGASRSMVAHQSAGNCNSCHTPRGANGAPGRIMAP